MNMIRYHRHRHWPRQAEFQNEMQQMFDRLFETGGDDSSMATAQWMPHVDIREDDTGFVLYADLPGIDPQDIEVHMDKGILSIKGERSTEQRSDDGNFSRVERHFGSFHRRFALPDSADAERISATGRNGVLEISIPKKPEVSPRRIAVGSARAAKSDERT